MTKPKADAKAKAKAKATARPKAKPLADPTARLRATVAQLRARLRDAEQTLDAIRLGHVDALVVQGPAGEQVFTLRGADHRYRQLVETMTEGALLLAPDGTIVYSNARFAELVTLPLEQLIGARLAALVPAAWHRMLEALLQRRGGQSSKAELEVVASDGTRVPVYLSATASWDEDDQVTCVIATDLSDQRRSQEMIAAERLTTLIVDQAAEGIVVCNLAGQVIRASQIAHRAAGDNALLRRFEDAFPIHLAGDGAIAREVIATALRGETISGLEVSLPRDGRDQAELLVSAGPIMGRGAEPLGCVVSFVDVTDRRRAAEERQQFLEVAQAARVDAETANRAKDEFLAMLGHELRNPLAPILTALELMRLKDDTALRRERAIIGRQVKHVVRLVDDLLDVSRIAEGKVVLDCHPVELTAIVTRAIEVASPLIEERLHQLEVDVAADLWLDGDEVRLCQVISNLLTNAAKYTPPSGHIRVRGVADGSVVVLTIRDDGVGIPPDILPHLFERFVQGKRTLDRSEGGLGLGLAIVRSLVAQHGGTVTAHSDGVGRGSELELRLPALDRVAASADAELTSAPIDLAAARRILVVDDNIDAANLLAEALDALGHDTRVAYDGPSALELAVGFVPDLAILDIGLPVMDGHELGLRLRALAGERALRLIAVTGYNQEADRQRSADAGFDVHLVKPIKIQELCALIDGAAR